MTIVLLERRVVNWVGEVMWIVLEDMAVFGG